MADDNRNVVSPLIVGMDFAEVEQRVMAAVEQAVQDELRSPMSRMPRAREDYVGGILDNPARGSILPSVAEGLMTMRAVMPRAGIQNEAMWNITQDHKLMRQKLEGVVNATEVALRELAEAQRKLAAALARQEELKKEKNEWLAKLQPERKRTISVSIALQATPTCESKSEPYRKS